MIALLSSCIVNNDSQKLISLDPVILDMTWLHLLEISSKIGITSKPSQGAAGESRVSKAAGSRAISLSEHVKAGEDSG
jgi:hypothetical protein